jgi:hypothetical protein
MSRPNERILVILGLAVVGGLIALTGYLGYRRVAEADAEQAAGATRVAALAPTWTAAAKPAPTRPPAAAPATAVPSATTAAPTPTSGPAATIALRPTVVTPAPTAAPVAATPRPTEEGRYLGNDPLPPGVDLTNGPLLKELKERGAKGANVGDGGLGDELKSAYVAALKVERQALNTGDDSQLQLHFTGEALERLQRLTARIKADTGNTMTVGVFDPRVMEFMPETATPGVYEVVDARTITIDTVERLPDGKPGKVIKPGVPSRACYSVQMTKVNGRWKVQSEDVETGGAEGGRCPPYWS